ncbi:MAG TPA: HEAT repeat domain-containing protein [Polyangiales bacterium]|nr:HEAT repeat domain-containing protein [Polyangiales bacterium]
MLPTARADDAEIHAKASQEARGEEAFKNALTRLGSEQASERAAAAEELGRRGYRFRKQIADALRPLLSRDPEPAVRAASGRALGRLGIREAVPELTRALGDPSADVRAVAAAALWRLPERSSVPALIEHTRDSDAKVREWSALALAATEDARALAPMIERLTDTDRAVRLAAVRGLGQLNTSESLAPLQRYLTSGSRDEEEKEEAVRAIAGTDGSERVAVLLALYAAAASDVAQKKRLLAVLGRVGDAQALPLLRKVSSEKDARFRAPAAAAYAAVLARSASAPDAGAR